MDSSSTAGSAAVPSLGDITAVYFTELPGVDIPGEPAPRKVGEVITFEQAHAVNKNKALLPLLKGREQLYSTTDRKCEIWIPGAIVLQIGESNSRERAYFIRTPSEQAYAFEVYEAPLDPGDMPDAVIKQVHDDLEATWTRDGGTVIHRRSVVTNGISGEELLVQDDARKVAVLSHCYCVDSTFYRLAEASTPRLEPTPTGKKFFESFRRRS